MTRGPVIGARKRRILRRAGLDAAIKGIAIVMVCSPSTRSETQNEAGAVIESCIRARESIQQGRVIARTRGFRLGNSLLSRIRG